jgi:choline dehydrogenase
VPGSTGVGSWAMNRNGSLRISTAIGYLAPARHRLNLTIRGRAHVHRILFDGPRASGRGRGVVQRAFGRHRARGGCAAARRAAAVGHRGRAVERLGVPVVHDLPAWGNLREHRRSCSWRGRRRACRPRRAAAADGPAVHGHRQRRSERHADVHVELRRRPHAQIRFVADSQYLFMGATLQRPKSAGRVCRAAPTPTSSPSSTSTCWPTNRTRSDDGRRPPRLGPPQLRPIADLTDTIISPTAELVADDDASGSSSTSVLTSCTRSAPARWARQRPAGRGRRPGRVHGPRPARGGRLDHAEHPRANTNLTAIMIGERVAALMRE